MMSVALVSFAQHPHAWEVTLLKLYQLLVKTTISGEGFTE